MAGAGGISGAGSNRLAQQVAQNQQAERAASANDPILQMINDLAAGTGAPIATESMFEEPQKPQMDLSGGGGATDMNQVMANVKAIADAAGGKGAIGTSAEFLLQGLQLMTEKIDTSDPDALAQQAKDMQTFMEYALNPTVNSKLQQILQIAEASPEQLAEKQAENAQHEADADNVLRNLGIDPDNLVADLGTAGANGNLGGNDDMGM